LDTLPLQAALPPLVLQPLLENAVHHGIEPSATGGWVQITGRYRRGRVNLGIRNSLPNPSAHAHRAGNQLALDNVRQRLEALFPGAASLREGRVEGDFQVRMVFPFPWRPL
jgi:two-component system sensor histidine kinase AlgZ